jgi:hypothetical protein
MFTLEQYPAARAEELGSANNASSMKRPQIERRSEGLVFILGFFPGFISVGFLEGEGE